MKSLQSFPMKKLAALALLAAPGTSFAQTTESGLTENQQATRAGITLLCGGQLAGNDSLTDPDALRLRSRCGEIVRNESSQIGDLGNALQRVQTEEIEVLASQGTEVSGTQLKNVGNRMQAIRAGAIGLSITGANWEDSGVPSGGMASADGFSRLGFFVNADYATGERDESSNVDGFEFDTSGITVGGDYRFSDTFVAGVAYHYLDSEADLDNNYGELDTQGQSLSVFATAYGDNFYVEGSIGAGEYEYDSLRVVDYHTDATFHENLSASPDGEQLTWSLGGGFNAHTDGFSHSYYGQLNSIDLEIDGYTESTNNVANGAMAMAVQEQEIESLQSELGVQLSYAMSQDFGVIHPYVDVAWIHEFEDGDDPIIARYANADLPADQNVSNVNLSAQTDEFDPDYFRLSLGASVGLSGGMQLFVNYDTLLGLEDFTYNAITAGLRLEL